MGAVPVKLHFQQRVGNGSRNASFRPTVPSQISLPYTDYNAVREEQGDY